MKKVDNKFISFFGVDSMNNKNEENKRRLMELKNIIIKWTLTNKHFEEYGAILSQEKIRQIINKQKRREEQIENLNKHILNIHDRELEVRNLVKNYLNTENYLNNNMKNLTMDIIEKIKKHQFQRKIHLENLLKKN